MSGDITGKPWTANTGTPRASGRDANQLAADATELRRRIDHLIARAPQTRASGWAAEALPLMFEASAAVGLVGTLQQQFDAAETQAIRNYVRAEAAEAALATTRQALAGPLRDALLEAGCEIHAHSDHPERVDFAAVLGEIDKAIAVARRALADTDRDTEEGEA